MAKPSDLLGEIAEVVSNSAGPDRDAELPNLDGARRSRQAARRAEALAYKLAGLPNAQIAERMGVSESGVIDLINRTLERATNKAAEEMRDIENARLDRAQAAIWTKVLAGDTKAVDTFLRISQRRARLNGLDAPTSINLSVSVRQEMEAALATLENVVLGQVISSSTDEEHDRDRD